MINRVSDTEKRTSLQFVERNTFRNVNIHVFVLFASSYQYCNFFQKYHDMTSSKDKVDRFRNAVFDITTRDRDRVTQYCDSSQHARDIFATYFDVILINLSSRKTGKRTEIYNVTLTSETEMEKKKKYSRSNVSYITCVRVIYFTSNRRQVSSDNYVNIHDERNDRWDPNRDDSVSK